MYPHVEVIMNEPSASLNAETLDGMAEPTTITGFLLDWDSI